MRAKDVMVTPVITVDRNTTVRAVAKMLLDNRISAVPVVDDQGKLVGIVSESDLMHRAEAGTERRHSWWLAAFESESALATDYLKSHSLRISDIMTRNVITVGPETPLHEIAAVLEKHQIRRVPIVGPQGDLVGIVSRANLLQNLATARPKLETTVPDATIRRSILDTLSKQRWTQSYKVNVTVANGVVDLWGAVDSDEERKALRVAAESVAGVAAVQDHLFRRPPGGWQ